MKNFCFHLNRKIWLTAVMLLAAMLPALAQNITVHGTVVDDLGEALIGATVMEKGTSNGTATDIDGNFQITVPPTATLVVSYVGYDPQEIAVNGQTNIKVTLKENATMLQETVVIGYGSVKKSDATGSVALITPDEIDANIATSAQDLLTGASPGVVVTSSGGSPEGGATIRIRGGASLNASNDPLIVLDGVPLSNDGINGMANPLAMIAPDNIESMTILKDASATAIYGSRASNGVIIITTKKGKSGRPQVNFSANVSVNTARKSWKALGAGEYRDMITDYWSTKDPAAVDALGDADTDWQKEILRTSVSHEYNLSVGGKAAFLPYRVSGSYTMNNGILHNSQMQRVTAGFNLTPEFFDGLLKVQANVKGYYIRNRFTDEGCTSTALIADPTRPIHSYWKNEYEPTMNQFPYLYGGYSVSASGRNINKEGVMNPVAQNRDQDNTADIYRSNGNLQIDYALHFLPELHLNLNLGYDVSKSNNNIYTPENSVTSWNNKDVRGGAGLYYHSYELRRNTLLDFYINYKKEFDAIYSNLDVMVGYSWQRFDSHGNNNGTVFTSNGFYAPNDVNGNLVPIVYDPANPDNTAEIVGKSIKPKYYWASGRLQLISFFGRLNYSFKDTYLLTFTLRDDGTSRFSKNNRWGLFPSVALGWKIANMDFFESARDKMNEFKLRLGWGQTGQQSVGGFFDYMGTYYSSLQGSWYPNMWNGQYGSFVNGQFVPGASPVYYPNAFNPDLKWETTTTWNVGFDMGWLNNRITLALDWYLRKSTDLLAEVPVAPGMATTNQMVRNIGDLKNVGIEATIGARVFDTPDFQWNTSLNVAWNKNKITKLNDSADEDFIIPVGGISMGTGNNIQAHKVGYPAFTFRTYEQIYDENGKPIEGAYVDQNGDGEINDKDFVMKHSPDPKVTMTWTNSFSYKNWDLSFAIRANIGNYIYNDARANRTYRDGTWQNTSLRNMIESDWYFNGQQPFSDAFLENAGFVRCDNITLGYTWPNLLDDHLRLRLYGAVQNPFVITKYTGIDPEIYGGIDRSTYPRPVTFTLGVIATF
mgnify:CR=1 FL=1